MKLRRPIALALVGWYLMEPPIGPRWWCFTPPCIDAIDLNAALGTWEIVQSFDTASACEKNKSDRFNADKDEFMLGNASEAEKFVLDIQLVNRECVSSEDPRLAK
jgi:hypothetical protein